jgi:hypothetical protein
MSTLISGAMTAMARARPAPALVGSALFFSVAGAILPAAADNGPLYVAPGPATLIAPPGGIKPGQDQFTGTVRKLGDLLGNSLSSPSHATDVVVTIKCGHYRSATISYADGTTKTLNLGNAPASQSDMDKARAAIPILHIVDESGC